LISTGDLRTFKNIYILLGGFFLARFARQYQLRSFFRFRSSLTTQGINWDKEFYIHIKIVENILRSEISGDKL